MEYLIDSSLWIDFSRRQSSQTLKSQIRPWVTGPDCVTCEPVVFEVMRNATADERRSLTEHLEVMALLSSPASLWRDAVTLGQKCRDAGFTIGALDLLIATVALHHNAEIVTFDADYSLIAQAAPALRVQLLARAA
jgi:predicted nucleic acid-binding protein